MMMDCPPDVGPKVAVGIWRCPQGHITIASPKGEGRPGASDLRCWCRGEPALTITRRSHIHKPPKRRRR